MRGSAIRLGSFVALVALTTACPGGGGGGQGRLLVCTTEAPEADAVRFAPAFDGESFSQPVALVQHPSDADRFYVVERGGRVFTFLASDPSGTRSEAVDLNDFISLFTDGEGGLFAMAFDPDFDANGEVFFSYTEGTLGDFDSVLGRFVSADGGLGFAPAAPDPTVLALPQPRSNHNGGDIDFGPGAPATPSRTARTPPRRSAPSCASMSRPHRPASPPTIPSRVRAPPTRSSPSASATPGA